MSDLGILNTAIGAVLAAPELFSSNEKMMDHYPALRTRKKKIDTWWDSLDWGQRVEVGQVALHYHMLTPNSRWWWLDECFNDLNPKQKKAIKFIWSKRHSTYAMFDLAGMMGLR